MQNLFLNEGQTQALNQAILELEEVFGAEYTYAPEVNEFSCKCSGPAQSCAWH